MLRKVLVESKGPQEMEVQLPVRHQLTSGCKRGEVAEP